MPSLNMGYEIVKHETNEEPSIEEPIESEIQVPVHDPVHGSVREIGNRMYGPSKASKVTQTDSYDLSHIFHIK